MNQLSIILYFADIGANVATVLGGFGLLFVIGFILFNFIRSIVVAVHNDEVERKYDKAYRKHGFICIPWFIAGVFLMVVSSLVPSKQTMYMIAASEIGETVVLSPEMTETMGKVKTVVDMKLDDVIAELSNDKVEPAEENK